MPDVTTYLKTFFEEKALPEITFLYTRDAGGFHHIIEISNRQVIDSVLTAPEHEQREIGRILRRLDFQNADVNGFLEHLGSALADEVANSHENLIG